jgi:putative acetyltransferase
MEIKLEDLTGPEIKDLLEEHLKFMYAVSPPESVHALNLDELRQPEISFWSAWEGDDLLGCGALKALGPDEGEIKSVNTAIRHRRKGVANRIMDHILSVARDRGYKKLYLETGSEPEFAPARHLYTSLGFEECLPFADYTNDPNSYFMQLEM